MVLGSSWIAGLSSVVAVAAYFIEDVSLPSITLYESKSANGSMTAPASINVGETGDFVVDLQDVNDFLTYDVQEVQIIKHSGVGTALTTQVAATIVPSADGQMQFTWQWAPTDQDVGDHTFSAFVVTKESPATPFEIEADATKTVSVGGAGGVQFGGIGISGVHLCRVDAGNQTTPPIVSDEDRASTFVPNGSPESSYSESGACGAVATSPGIPEVIRASASLQAQYEADASLGADGRLLSFEGVATVDVSEAVEGVNHVTDQAQAYAFSDSSISLDFNVMEETPFTLSVSLPPNPALVGPPQMSLRCDSVLVAGTGTSTTVAGVILAGSACQLYVGGRLGTKTSDILEENGTRASKSTVNVSITFP